MEQLSLQSLEQDAYYAVMLVMACTPLDWVGHVPMRMQDPALCMCLLVARLRQASITAAAYTAQFH